MTQIREWAPFIGGLEDVGCRVLEQSEDCVLVSVPDIDGILCLSPGDYFVHVSAVLLPTEDIAAFGHCSAIAEFALRLHTRALGCRFAFNEKGSMEVTEDIEPAMQTTELTMLVFNQLGWVANAVEPLFDSILATGCIPLDVEVEAAFGVAWEEEG